VTINERIAAGRRERRVLMRVSRAAWRLEQAERERTWALVSAHAEGISIRKLAAAAGLSPSRVHQLVADADLDVLDAALGELRAAGWPAPEDPDSGEDAELDGRDSIAGRLSDEVSWLRQCADWLAHLDADSCQSAVNLRPSADWPDRAVVAVDLARVRAVIDRIAADVDELARARRVEDLDTAAVLPGRRAERRRRLAEPDLEFRAFCACKGLPASSTPQLERAWDAWQTERYRRGEISQRPADTGNPFRLR
jgi:AcrR family transcriptional regulator